MYEADRAFLLSHFFPITSAIGMNSVQRASGFHFPFLIPSLCFQWERKEEKGNMNEEMINQILLQFLHLIFWGIKK